MEYRARQQNTRQWQAAGPQGRHGPPRIQGQRRAAQPHNRRQQADPQFHSRREGYRQWDAYAPQQRNRNPRGDQRFTPQQRKQAMRKREAALKHFDKDGDGRLSEKERKAARKAVQQRKGDKNPGESPE
jgi:hypothetical protein